MVYGLRSRLQRRLEICPLFFSEGVWMLESWKLQDYGLSVFPYLLDSFGACHSRFDVGVAACSWWLNKPDCPY